MSISTEEKDRYLRETAIVLAREGFQTGKTDTGKLRVLLDGAPLCEVTENGGITYRNEDIRLSLYCSQQGKCAVTGKILEIGRMHCHHKTAKHLGGNDSYANLTLIDVDVHTLIHATKEETVKKLLVTLQLDKKQLEKVNKLRNLLHLNEILQ